MKQLMYIKKNKLEWQDAKEPTLQSAGDVIVRPLAAARCDGDKVFSLLRHHSLLGQEWLYIT